MKKILLILLSIILSLSFFGCGKTKEYNIHTEAQESYLKGSYTQITAFCNGTSELSRPNPVTLSIDKKTADIVGLHLYEIKEVGGIDTIKANGRESINIYNLKTGTTYEWYLDNELMGTFKIKDGLRNLYIDGLTNCRDIGGYNVEDGKVKQGMIIRTSKLTDDDTGKVLITELGINTIKGLGIKTELDLRSTTPDSDGLIEQGGITKSVIDGVNYISLPMKSGGNYLQLNRDKLKDLFEILGNEENYPILMHCSIGTDRTGLVSFLVDALLGVEKEDLYRDYLFSNFGNIGGLRTASTINDYFNKVTSSSRLSLSENVRKFLINEGVNSEDIDNVIRIMKKYEK